jgi:hypothetical protein
LEDVTGSQNVLGWLGIYKDLTKLGSLKIKFSLNTKNPSSTMKLTNFLSTLSLIAAVAAYPFMADYHAMTDAQKRDYTEMYKRIATRDVAPRDAAAICEYGLWLEVRDLSL